MEHMETKRSRMDGWTWTTLVIGVICLPTVLSTYNSLTMSPLLLALEFGGYGGFLGLAFLCLILASQVQRRRRLTLCIVSWLLGVVQIRCWVLILGFVGLAHSSGAAEKLRVLETVYWIGIILGTIVTAAWSYALLRNPSATNQNLPVTPAYEGPRCVACREPVEAGIVLCPHCGWTQPA